MTTATLEPTATAQAPALAISNEPASPPPQFMTIDELTSAMAVILHRPIDEMRSQLLDTNPTLFVSTTTANEMIDRQIRQLQAVQARLKPAVPSVKAEATPPQSANGKAPAAKKSAAKIVASGRKSRAKVQPVEAAEAAEEVSAAS